MEIAKKRIRIGAFLIDIFIFWSIAMIVGIFYGTPHEEGIGYSLNGLPALVMFLVGFFLWPISEGIWGRTIGKRLLNLKVVTDDFEPIGMGQEFGRFILGFLDYIFLIGLIIATTNKQNKRIGDIAAKTIVVNTKALESNLVKFQ
ncbi:RDD family protein [Flagellimonas sp.]|jgi:uncharacterized RDD family membrane protein YckC|uniref:RDD family protein n=1 Tax=Flagellimonas sp. TaxID=2058762 RepID=UPI003BAD3F5C